MTQPIFIRPNKAPEVFGISRSTLYRWANAGAFVIQKRGKISYVRVADVEAYMSASEGQ